MGSDKRSIDPKLVALVIGVVFFGAVVIFNTMVLGLGDRTIASDQSVGVSAGGAQDANAFRTNIENDYVPQPSDITYEGLFHDYRFETGRDRPCQRRFCPTYARAISPDPLSGETDRYVAVGLDSGITKSDLDRPNVTMIVVLDTSGSMSSRFDEYHYDGESRGQPPTKLETATQSIATLREKLGPGDRMGIVSYDHSARTVLPVTATGKLSERGFDERLSTVSAGGSTNIEAGMEAARQMSATYRYPGENRTTRIVYVTDAMPNRGAVSVSNLSERIQTDAYRGVYSTFVGVGVDFNTELTDALADTRGANYYSVDSPRAFESRMEEGFTYMITPLAHDLSVTVDAPNYEIVDTYGAPSDSRKGALIEVSTLFPSRSGPEGGEGSVILLELDNRTTQRGPIKLEARYETPDGTHHSVTRRVDLPQRSEYYETSGVRKAVALTRYATLLRNWAAYERSIEGSGSFDPPEGVDTRPVGKWEQESVPLTVSSPYDERIERFSAYLISERRALGDDRLTREIELLDRLRDEIRDS